MSPASGSYTCSRKRPQATESSNIIGDSHVIGNSSIINKASPCSVMLPVVSATLIPAALVEMSARICFHPGMKAGLWAATGTMAEF